VDDIVKEKDPYVLPGVVLVSDTHVPVFQRDENAFSENPVCPVLLEGVKVSSMKY
jgi:hypothetical protein